jgi:hypothetical protein
MIVGLVGKITKKEPTLLNVNVNGIIYEIFVSLNCSSKIISDEVKLEITHIIREDSQALYGFLDINEKKLLESIKSYNIKSKQIDSIKNNYQMEIKQENDKIIKKGEDLLKNYNFTNESKEDVLKKLSESDKLKYELLEQESVLLEKKINSKNNEFKNLYSDKVGKILNQINMDTTELKKVLGVETDEAIQAAVTNLVTRVESLQSVVDQHAAQAEAAKELEISNYVTEAITAGKITATVKDSMINLAKTDFEAVKNIIETAKPAPLVNLIDEGKEPETKMTKEEATKIYNSWKLKNKVGRMAQDDPDKYMEVRNALKG